MKLVFISFIASILFIRCNTSEKSNEHTVVKNANTIIIKGSDTEYPMVREMGLEFTKANPDIQINISGEGSNVGINALIHNEVDIANSSRKMRSDEIESAKKNGVQPIEINFSFDALAIITNYKLGIDSLSTEELTKIFSGEIANWKALGGPDLPIVIYGRDSTSGTYSYLKEHFIRAPYSAKMVQLTGNAEVVKKVQSDVGAIGFAGVGFLKDSTGKPNGSIWAMPIYKTGVKACSPYETDAVIHGRYLLSRPLYQYINGKPRAQLFDFIMSELVKKGQDIIKQHGYFPLTDYQVEINKLNGVYNTTD